jgi:hypothetical protein
MDEPEDLRLVKNAITHRLPRCFQWRDQALVERVRNDRRLKGLTPKFIRADVIGFVSEGSEVIRKPEGRPEFKDDYPFKYIVKLEYDDFDRPIFVEMRLEVSDPEYPVVLIVSVHPDGE